MENNPKDLKVFATRALSRSHWPTTERQPSIIVAAKSRAAATRAFAEVTPMTDSHLKTYGGITGNAVQIEAAMSEPGTVFVSTTAYSQSPGDYVPLRPEVSTPTTTP